MPAEHKPERTKEDERRRSTNGKSPNQQRRDCGSWRDSCTWHGLRFIAAFGLARARCGGIVAQATRLPLRLKLESNLHLVDDTEVVPPESIRMFSVGR